MTCPNSQDGRHNFPVAGGNCIFCRLNQNVLSGKKEKTFSVPTRPLVREKKKGMHSEFHEFVAILRRELGEEAKKGKGSFGFYLKVLKPVPLYTMQRWVGNIKESKNLTTPLAKAKVFWWNYKQWKTKGGEVVEVK